MGIISNCFGFNFHGKNTISGRVLFAQSTCFPLKLSQSPYKLRICLFGNNFGLVWQFWNPLVLSSNGVPAWIATNYWTAIAAFFQRGCQKKGQLERVSKVLKLPWHICTAPYRLLFASNLSKSGQLFVGYNIKSDQKTNQFKTENCQTMVILFSQKCIEATYMRLNVVIVGFVKTALMYN